MNKIFSRLCLGTGTILILLVTNVFAQTTGESVGTPAHPIAQSSFASNTKSVAEQSVITSLSSLPEADTLIYFSPQRILNDAVPKVLAAADLEKMRSSFSDVKQLVGVDPSKIDYLVIAVRFKKPAADLSFVPPDVMAVVSGDFSADSLLTVASLYLQEQKFREEKYGTKTLTLLTIDPVAKAAEKNPLLKSFAEVGFVTLSANTFAIGTTAYLKAAVDAGAGTGRISADALNSLLRDPNALVSAAGSPLTAFAKSFGLLGTETTPRQSRCETRFGDFYSAVTMDATNFSLRGAMNADNPDTAKIINGLLSSLLQQAVSSVPDKSIQTVLHGIKMMPKENEVVWEADISQQAAADFLKQQTKPVAPSVVVDKAEQPVKRPMKSRRRTRRKP